MCSCSIAIWTHGWALRSCRAGAPVLHCGDTMVQPRHPAARGSHASRCRGAGPRRDSAPFHRRIECRRIGQDCRRPRIPKTRPAHRGWPADRHHQGDEVQGQRAGERPRHDPTWVSDQGKGGAGQGRHRSRRPDRGGKKRHADVRRGCPRRHQSGRAGLCEGAQGLRPGGRRQAGRDGEPARLGAPGAARPRHRGPAAPGLREAPECQGLRRGEPGMERHGDGQLLHLCLLGTHDGPR